MKNDKEKLRFLIEENKQLLEELRKLQTKYVQERLFAKNGNPDDELDMEIRLEQKVDVLIRFLLTGRRAHNCEKDLKTHDRESAHKATEELALYDYAFLVKKFQAAGFRGVQRYLEDLPVSGTVRAQAWKGLATRLSEQDMRKAAGAAWRSWLADPTPERLKWLAFRMYEADEIFLADMLIKMLPPELPLSGEEKRKVQSIQSRLRQRTAYLRGLRELERTNISNLRKKIMHLEQEKAKIEQLEKEKKALLNMIQLKDEHLEKINNENVKYKNLLKAIKEQFA